jgi:hypothetical protein
MPEITMITLGASAREYSTRRASLVETVQTLTDQIEALKRRALPAIRRQVAALAEAESALRSQIDDVRHLFVKPKTVVLEGVQIGLRKLPGVLEWDDDARLIKRIRDLVPEVDADILIKTTEAPIKKALANLPATTLKKLGVRILETGDEVVVKPADSEVDKVVQALLSDAVETEPQP